MLHCTDKLYQSKTHQHWQCTQLQSNPYTNKGQTTAVKVRNKSDLESLLFSLCVFLVHHSNACPLCTSIYDFKVLFCFTINITAKIMKTKIKHWNLKRIHSKFQGSDLPSKSRAQDHIHIAQNLSWKKRLKGVVRWTIWMSKKICVRLNFLPINGNQIRHLEKRKSIYRPEYTVVLWISLKNILIYRTAWCLITCFSDSWR